QDGNVKEIASINADGYDFVVYEGVARYAFGTDNNLKDHVYYRSSANDNWTELPTNVIGKQFVPQAISADGKKVYSIGNPSGGPNEFAISNLDGSGRRVLASNPRVSIGRVFWTPAPHSPYAAVAVDGKPVITYFDDGKYAKILKALNAKFADQFV